MTKEEKELLLRDLCARLPYGVKIHLETSEHGGLIGILDAIYPTEERVIVDDLNKAIAPINVRCGGFKIEENNVKPYLRPMSSMTKEEKKIYMEISSNLCGEIAAKTMIDWLNKNHFDYRGLIERGLAIEVTEENNPYKE
jgi:hypothetical protein